MGSTSSSSLAAGGSGAGSRSGAPSREKGKANWFFSPAATAVGLFLGLAGTIVAARRYARASRDNGVSIHHPAFFHSLRFRPGVDQTSAGAFTANSPKYGKVIVSYKFTDRVSEQKATASAITRSNSPCSLTLDQASAGYAFFTTLLPQQDGSRPLSVEVTLLDQMLPKAAKKALRKKFPPKQVAMLEEFDDLERYLNDVCGGEEVLAAECAWIPGILDGSKEADRVVSIGKHGVLSLHPHTQWDTPATAQRFLYLFRDQNLKSIRDLRAEHVPMLNAVKSQILSALRDLQGADFDPNQLLLFFHYRPTFWWLHLHVVRLESHAYAEQARSQVLEDIVLALTSVPDFMHRASFVVLAGADEVEMQAQERRVKGDVMQQLHTGEATTAAATAERSSSGNVASFPDESSGDDGGDSSSSSSSSRSSSAPASPQPKAGRSDVTSPTSAAVGNAADIQPLQSLGRRPRHQHSSEQSQNESVSNAEQRAAEARGSLSPTAAAVGLAADIQPVHALGRKARHRSSR